MSTRSEDREMLALNTFVRCNGVIASSSKSAFVLSSCVNEAVGQIRFAGGGGRPGGRPAFGWKEKKQLQLREKGEKLKVFDLKNFGDFDDIKHFIDTSRGDFIIDITDLNVDFSKYFGTPEEQASIAAKMEKEDNSRKQVVPAMLFGSNKTTGQILKKYNYNRITWQNHPNRAYGFKNKASSAVTTGSTASAAPSAAKAKARSV